MAATTPTTRERSPERPVRSAEYLLGTGIDESVRLGLQHRIWSAAAHEVWERAGIQPGMTVLDIGCGPGYATMDLAQLVGPSGRVIALDESAPFLKQLNDDAKSRRMGNIHRVLGDAGELATILADARGEIDAAYARWVLCFLPDPEAVIAGLAALLRPHGRFIVQDYFNYQAFTLAPRRPEFERVVDAVVQSWKARGGDPDVVARLPGLLRKHGFRLEHLEARERVARPGTTLWHWPDTFFRNFVPKLVQMGFLEPEEHAAFERMWAEVSQDRDSFLVAPTVFDVIARREG